MNKLLLWIIVFSLLVSSVALADDVIYSNTDGDTSGWSCDGGITLTSDSGRLKFVGGTADNKCKMTLPVKLDEGFLKYEFLQDMASSSSSSVSFTLMDNDVSNPYVSGASLWTNFESTQFLKSAVSSYPSISTTDPVSNNIYQVIMFVNVTSGTCEYNLSVYDNTAVSSIYSNASFGSCYVDGEDLGALGLYHFRTTGTWIFDDIKITNITGDEASNSIELLFSNKSYSPYKSVFDSGEDFYTFINWSDDSDDSPINESLGVCNITLFNATEEDESSLENFTVCGSGCTYTDEITDSFEFDSTNNVVTDYFYVDVCHDNQALDGFDFTIDCGVTSTQSIQSTQFPLCSNGFAEVRINDSSCIGKTNINVTLTANIPNNKRKRFYTWSADREYSENLLDYNEGDLYFNASIGLWQTNEIHESYNTGQDTVLAWANCSYTSDNNLDNSVSESIDILGLLPIIAFSQVNTSLGFTNLVPDVIIEYAGGIWTWFGAVIDDDPDTINFTWYNVSGHILRSEQFSVIGSPEFVQTLDEDFVDFDGNPYNLTIWVNDSEGNTTTDFLLFNVTDTQNPTIIGINNNTNINLTNHTFTHILTDQYLWLYNVSCDDGYNFKNESIGSTTYEHTFSRLINNSLTCDYEICDGHTGELINPIEGKLETDTIISLGKSNFTISVGIEKFSTLNYFDRTKFIIETKNPTTGFNIKLGEDWVEAKNSRYKGHYINLKTKQWIDFEGDNTIIPNGNNVYIYSKKAKTEFSFNSIGVLNCISGSQTIEGYEEEEETESTNIIPEDFFNSLVLYLVISVGIILWGELVRSGAIMMGGVLGLWWVAGLVYPYSKFLFGLFMFIGLVEILRAIMSLDRVRGGV